MTQIKKIFCVLIVANITKRGNTAFVNNALNKTWMEFMLDVWYAVRCAENNGSLIIKIGPEIGKLSNILLILKLKKNRNIFLAK